MELKLDYIGMCTIEKAIYALRTEIRREMENEYATNEDKQELTETMAQTDKVLEEIAKAFRKAARFYK